MEKTIHFTNDRNERINYIINEIGVGTIIDSFIVDKGHKNGEEIHSITTTGIIIIQNLRTKKLVTMLIARPQQIRRYYEAEGRKAPLQIVELARKHQERGDNNR